MHERNVNNKGSNDDASYRDDYQIFLQTKANEQWNSGEETDLQGLPHLSSEGKLSSIHVRLLHRQNDPARIFSSFDVVSRITIRKPDSTSRQRSTGRQPTQD